MSARKVPTISERLKTVASCVNSGSFVIDIGCDHCLTSIYLVNTNVASEILAIDNKKGPLEGAKLNVSKFGCANEITLLLSDGLSEVMEEMLTTIFPITILMSGIGGGLACQILNNRKDIVSKASQLVIQAQSELFKVRETIIELGFTIVKERMVYEDNKYYTIIVASRDKEDNKKEKEYEKYELYFGRMIDENDKKIYSSYLEREVKLGKKALEAILSGGNTTDAEGKEEIIALADAALNKL